MVGRREVCRTVSGGMERDEADIGWVGGGLVLLGGGAVGDKDGL